MDERLDQSREVLIEALGRQSAFWGLGKAAGEMYAVLYLSPGPIPMEELAAKLNVTKGNVSVAIRQLEHLHLVRRSQQRGDRRVFFEAETDFVKIAHSVLSRRHKPEFEESFALVQRSAALAKAAVTSSERTLTLERLKALLEFYALLDSAVESLLAMSPDQLKQALQLMGQLAKE